MPETKHTPGPRAAVPDHHGKPLVVTYRDGVDPKDWEPAPYSASITLGIGDHTEQRTHGNEWANAKLIAAAPDLLLALQVARRELHACQAVIHLRGGFDPAYVDDAQRALQGMDAVIAKATE